MSEQKYTLSTRQFPLVDKKSKTPKFNFPGVTLRIGPSDLTGDTIATVAVFNSTNGKTGNVIQIYYIVVGHHPIDASKNLADAAVCGNCPLKPSSGNECYVRLGHGPSKVWITYHNGRYPELDQLPKAQRKAAVRLLKSKPIRLGAHGDPLADIKTSRYLAAINPNVLAYTHQWKHLEGIQNTRSFIMASVDTPEDYRRAKENKWRTYRHTSEDLAFDNEIICPHSSHGTQCVDCMLCNGNNDNSSDRDIVTRTL